jgi:hypothetical protein
MYIDRGMPPGYISSDISKFQVWRSGYPRLVPCEMEADLDIIKDEFGFFEISATAKERSR